MMGGNFIRRDINNYSLQFDNESCPYNMLVTPVNVVYALVERAAHVYN